MLGYCLDITHPAQLEMERNARENPVQPPFTAEQALGLIRMAGGLAVLVPPNEMDDTFPVAAFDGIAAYGSHARADTARYLSLARRYGLIVTGGSAFSAKTGRRTGRALWTFTDRNSGFRRIFLPQQPFEQREKEFSS